LAEIRKRNNLPAITRSFRSIALLSIQRMEDELADGVGKVIYKDYIKATNEYLIPILGKRKIGNIDRAALDDLDAKRIARMGKTPARSTLLNHNAALQRIFDEAEQRGHLTHAARPKLDAKGRVSERRPAFTVEEIRRMLDCLQSWSMEGRDDKAKESRALMRGYVLLLLDTGARPGKELLNLRWNQIETAISPITSNTGAIDEESGEEVKLHDLRRSVLMHVTGKTGARLILGMKRSYDALKEIAMRNYPKVAMPVLNPLQAIATPENNDYVFRTSKGKDITSTWQKMFDRFLEAHDLQIDPVTQKHRVLYSLRHTYATFALTYDKTNPHTLARQMGTSIGMLEKHYSHLKVQLAIDQLRGEESRQLIDSRVTIDSLF
jgi:integrase